MKQSEVPVQDHFPSQHSETIDLHLFHYTAQIGLNMIISCLPTINIEFFESNKRTCANRETKDLHRNHSRLTCIFTHCSVQFSRSIAEKTLILFTAIFKKKKRQLCWDRKAIRQYMLFVRDLTVSTVRVILSFFLTGLQILPFSERHSDHLKFRGSNFLERLPLTWKLVGEQILSF